MACVSLFVFFLLSRLLLLHSAEEVNRTLPNCSSFQCGKLGIIGFPFTDSSHPLCGLLPVKCDEMPPTIQLGWSRGPYEVINISYTNTTLITRIKDLLLSDALITQKCESVTNFTLPNSPFISFKLTTPSQTLFKCNRTLGIASPRNFTRRNCGDYSLYYSHLNDDSQSFPAQCSIIQLPRKKHSDKDTLFSLLSAEFDLEVNVSEACSSCYGGGGHCELEQNGKFQCDIAKKVTWSQRRLKATVIATSSVGIGVLMVIICCFWGKFSLNKIINFWKKETLTHQDVEAFLRNHGPLVIRRYSYADIKTMTKSFNDKLGQGGYSNVYKGKLQDGCFVAVKVLKESKGNGDEFVNEVASISRTSHVNIVTLKGFCIEGSKRALIYEFMSNGSLEKFIYKGNPSNSNHQLGWETLYKISIGIARGLEYLHRGCNAQILHFDIKPHNILLDENFCPKISDFGLAKICPREKSFISMVSARGTIGYMAPEVFCRNFGGISHKSDVYSYGMMVLEMVGGRKNFDASVDFTSEIYFPHWIYKRLELGEELGLLGLLEKVDQENARKMIMVSLWCIQSDPSIRPSMSKVVNMLEGSLEPFKIPPKPFLCSPPSSPVDSSTIMV
ncbi:LEAF RUST 10 DISEASE-RESISTANCE LOCUS RECEPTOR-LIKE PROTEIN KINASE-like 2.4 isoform X1 [Castanea sativa]|uniref:LEAF RUST 10 DISEASE-RESISTANCE LOCUS RECEPTOR-LIKE PROTEIN KINASE-like 2.4 isoform X1 n=1 Tax=Castanea sativa TaxID=21020 RepID=UPI003F6498C0